jgi:hypothetical protein
MTLYQHFKMTIPCLSVDGGEYGTSRRRSFTNIFLYRAIFTSVLEKPGVIKTTGPRFLSVVVCRSTVDNYGAVSTLQDDDTAFVHGWWGIQPFVDHLRVFNARGDMLGLQIQVRDSPVTLGTVPWALSVIY